MAQPFVPYEARSLIDLETSLLSDAPNRDTVTAFDFPLPPGSQAIPEQRQSDPTPTHTIPGELHQLRAHVESTRIRAGYLEALVDPSLADEVTEAKRVMKDTHMILERLHRKINACDFAVIMAEVKLEAWQVYQRLVRLEDEVRGLWNRRQNPYREKDPQSSSMGSNSPETVVRTRLDRDMEGRTEPSQVSDPSPNEQSWLDDEDDVQVGAYLMSGALPYMPLTLQAGVQGRGVPSRPSSRFSEGSDDSITALPVFPYDFNSHENVTSSMVSVGQGSTSKSSSDDVFQTSPRSWASHKLARTLSEVQKSCREEEHIGTVKLREPDREREGSTSGHFATFVILSGIDDPSYFIPKLWYIKIHEIRPLCGWLVQRKYLAKSGNIESLEKVLHLFILFQEGCRLESVATLFSRTPRQVQSACKEVFEGLLELHSETFLPRRQPTCDHLWGISRKFFNAPHVVRRASQYYGWSTMDVVKVLVTLNLYIGRFRQQGQFALQGPYFKWWRHLSDIETPTRRWR